MTLNSARISSLKADPAAAPIHGSLDFYYGNAEHDAALDAFYAQFVRPGDLVFDVGAHVGDHTGSFRRLGARVVAVEPQPLCSRAIRTIYADDADVVVVEAACGASESTVTFYVNSANPTVSTVSKDFVEAADGAGGWEGQVWDTEIHVPTVTLDSLIGQYGTPAFTKIDVEGFEDAVLAGLSTTLPALSFEFTTIERAVARRALDRAAALGFERFNLSLGGSMTLDFDAWASAETMAAHLAALPHEANSGDVYCLP
ncbi:methyltransferase, FkbM family [Cryptosporangium aurantiacum]|uniref:Methyltransferase, FkbM family n=1 Tax=Cryptosporangium aurantiacum TaxID=134849 RepID=A0A1M7RQ77_9ACTN|nr:FkbM family methyltransferase [Cryptosporangium aurantiacum]SHN48242.1 methyltransferase, FkbM family [Cryptosporangium aurantiacum]